MAAKDDFLMEAVEPKEAIAHFKRKGYKISEHWNSILAREHARAFTVARAMSLDLLQNIRKAVDQAVADGIAFEDFKNRLEDIIRAGWTPANPQHVKIIYDTNLRSSWAAGTYEQIQATKEELPWLRYVDPSPNPRPQHLEWSEAPTILRADDPFWDKTYPPNGFNCVPGETLINTPTGHVPIGSLHVNDLVRGGSGNFYPTIAIHRRAFSGNVCRITIEGRTCLAATPNHRILTLRGWIPAGQLQCSDILVQPAEISTQNSFIHNINQMYAGFRNCTMTLPGKWETLMMRCFDTKVQRRQIHINPKRTYTIIINRSELLQMCEQQLFTFSWLRFCIWMFFWMSGITTKCGNREQGAHFWPTRRSANTQFFGSTFISRTGKFSQSQSRMRINFSQIVERSTSSFTAFKVILPLQSNRIRQRTLPDATFFNQALKWTKLNIPTAHDTVETQRHIYIQSPERNLDGAPLHFFNSLDDFRYWATRTPHVRLLHITNLKTERFDGNVYNLSVKNDKTYYTQIGVLHNCHCYIDQLGDKDLEDRNLAVSERAPEGEADEGFRGNAGKEGIEYAAEQALAEKLDDADDDVAAAIKAIKR